MVALGVGTFFIGYAISVYGYCLVRGYNVAFTDLFHSAWGGASIPAAGNKKAATAKDTPA